MRFYLAFYVSKLTKILLKLIGRDATYFPGKVAITICPDYLKKIKRSKDIICVTGTDGKTTTTNLLADVIKKCGRKPITNTLGANIDSGIATVLTNGLTLNMKLKYDIAVLELDEHYVRKVCPVLKPQYLVVTNIIRDSLKRNAHPEYVFNKINQCDYKDMTVILNSDDLCSSYLLEDNKRIYYGIDKLKTDLKYCKNIVNDYKYCPNCGNELVYDYVRYCHIGKAHCNNCGFKSKKSDYSAVLSNKLTVKNINFNIINDSIFNIYNELAVITTLLEFGINKDVLLNAINNTKLVETRFTENKVNNINVIKMMSKGNNSIPVSLVFDDIRKRKGNKIIVMNIDDFTDYNEMEFVGWIYDTDFEFLKNDKIKQIIVSGKRCYDNKIRLLLAGIDSKKIVCNINETEAISKIKLKNIDSIYILHDMSSYKESVKAENEIINIIKEKK